MFRRSDTFYSQNNLTGRQESLHTKDKNEALRLLNAKIEAASSSVSNLQMAKIYLSSSDPKMSMRNWGTVMEEGASLKTDETKLRWERAMKSKGFDPLRSLVVIQTQPEHFLRVLERGTVCTNIFLRRLQNLAVDLGFFPWPVLPKARWPKIKFKEKRGITFDEHQKILSNEKNLDSKIFINFFGVLAVRKLTSPR